MCVGPMTTRTSHPECNMETSQMSSEGPAIRPQPNGPMEIIEAIRSLDDLSNEAQTVLVRLEEADVDLSSISTDELSDLLLNCLS